MYSATEIKKNRENKLKQCNIATMIRTMQQCYRD